MVPSANKPQNGTNVNEKFELQLMEVIIHTLKMHFSVSKLAHINKT